MSWGRYHRNRKHWNQIISSILHIMLDYSWSVSMKTKFSEQLKKKEWCGSQIWGCCVLEEHDMEWLLLTVRYIFLNGEFFSYLKNIYLSSATFSLSDNGNRYNDDESIEIWDLPDPNKKKCAQIKTAILNLIQARKNLLGNK